MIDESLFFVRGCIDIPVVGLDEPLSWGVWVSLSEKSFIEWIGSFDDEHRSHLGPYFGWLNTRIEPYPDTVNLKTMVHLRDHGLRPSIELEPTQHPLAVEQRHGISQDRLVQIYETMLHDQPD